MGHSRRIGMKAVRPDVLEGITEFGFTAAMDMGAPIATVVSYAAMFAFRHWVDSGANSCWF